MVESVRHQRAMAALRITSPKIGRRSTSRSMKRWIVAERFHEYMKNQRPPPPPGKTHHQLAMNQSEIDITKRVGPGRSAPKLLKRSLKTGITKIMITAVTTSATVMIDTG